MGQRSEKVMGVFRRGIIERIGDLLLTVKNDEEINFSKALATANINGHFFSYMEESKLITRIALGKSHKILILPKGEDFLIHYSKLKCLLGFDKNADYSKSL